MTAGRPEEQEPLGALMARLIEDGRALAKAELALFRTDFYRRIGRARTGALLCLIGAIMGQAAAVTFLVTLSFVLTPWIGRLGGAAVSVLLGVGVAVLLIRIGVRKLMLVVEDADDDDEADGIAPVHPSPIDELFERVRRRSQDARNQLVETVGEAQARLHPQALVADLAEIIVDQAQEMSHKAIDAIRRRPGRAALAVAALVMLVLRPPLYRIARGIARATRSGPTSFSSDRRQPPSARDDEETSA
ncbi:phage holin family protein [Sphingomonas sp. YL-JM2C]